GRGRVGALGDQVLEPGHVEVCLHHPVTVVVDQPQTLDVHRRHRPSPPNLPRPPGASIASPPEPVWTDRVRRPAGAMIPPGRVWRGTGGTGLLENRTDGCA